jgi:serine/threonine protein kinase
MRVQTPGERTPGTVIGSKYRLIRRLGEGSAGQVWEAENKLVARRVAVKILRDDLARDVETRGRFMAEARAAGRIRHPNVVDVFDLGLTETGVPFMVMELCDGETLDMTLEARGAMGASYACDLLCQILAALESAHEIGIVHRDLKPGNVMVMHPRPDRPMAKVLDFGIAQGVHDTRPKPDERGRVFGTPSYMAPEQITGEPVDQRADLYSVGAIAYELLSGRPPFTGSSPELVLASVLSRPPKPLRAFVAELPEELEALVKRALEKDPADRPESARAFARELSVFGSASVAPPRFASSDVPLPLVPRSDDSQPKSKSKPQRAKLELVASSSWPPPPPDQPKED